MYWAGAKGNCLVYLEAKTKALICDPYRIVISQMLDCFVWGTNRGTQDFEQIPFSKSTSGETNAGLDPVALPPCPEGAGGLSTFEFSATWAASKLKSVLSSRGWRPLQHSFTSLVIEYLLGAWFCDGVVASLISVDKFEMKRKRLAQLILLSSVWNGI